MWGTFDEYILFALQVDDGFASFGEEVPPIDASDDEDERLAEGLARVDLWDEEVDDHDLATLIDVMDYFADADDMHEMAYLADTEDNDEWDIEIDDSTLANISYEE